MTVKDGEQERLEAEVARLDARVRSLEAELTQARAGETERSASAERERLFTEAMTDVVWTSDLQFRWTWMSPSVELLLGYTPEECLKLTPADTLTPASLAVALANLEAGHKVIFADRSIVAWPHAMEIEQVRKDGTTVWTEVRVTVMRSPDGIPYGFLGVTRDISKRKAAEDALRDLKGNLERIVEERTRELSLANERLLEEIAARERAVCALRRSEGRFRSINECASDLVTVLDRDGAIKYESPSVKRILGLAPEERVGRRIWDFIHPEDAPRVLERIRHLFAHPGSIERAEFRYRHADGRYILLESTGNMMSDWRESGEFIVHSRDVTEQRRLEAEAARMERL